MRMLSESVGRNECLLCRELVQVPMQMRFDMVASLETMIPMGLILIAIGAIASIFPLSESEKARDQGADDDRPSDI